MHAVHLIVMNHLNAWLDVFRDAEDRDEGGVMLGSVRRQEAESANERPSVAPDLAEITSRWRACYWLSLPRQPSGLLELSNGTIFAAIAENSMMMAADAIFSDPSGCTAASATIGRVARLHAPDAKDSASTVDR
jgi:hypothetical protein